MKNRRRTGWCLAFVLALAAAGGVASAYSAETKEKKEKKEEAKVAVDGVGLWRDRELRFALSRLLDAEAKATLEANAIEDGAVILQSVMGDEGFQNPTIKIEITRPDGEKQEFTFDPTFAKPLPRPLSARRVAFKVTPGVRSHVVKVEVSGLTGGEEKRARAFFRTESTMFRSARMNAYAPGRVNRGADSLLSELRQGGYADADVKATKASETEKGEVTLRVEVTKGPKWTVGEVTYNRDVESVKLPETKEWLEDAWSQTLQDDIREAVRRAYYKEGYPDVGVHVAAEGQPSGEGKKAEVMVTIVPGEHVTVGEVQFQGNTATREKVLRRRVRLNTGDPLDPVSLERARFRISRLGVFETVDLRYEPAEGAVRNPIFALQEGPRYETHLLFGYGSYEQFRAGVEHRQMNIFGLAHQSRLEAVQSVKSTSVDYNYTVPELFGESIDGTVHVFGLQRQEISFLRQEYGASLSVGRSIRPIDAEAVLGYTYEALRNRDSSLGTQATDEANINSASLHFGLTGDRRDNPLLPRRGYSWATQIEAAAPILGGEATYQRYELSGSYHTRWGEGRWVHVGLSYGALTTFGADDRTLPVNKRFLPGGDNSIRGYQRGEAAPRGEDGLFVGAKSFLLLNLELERALTPNWSVVVFADGLGATKTLQESLFAEPLYTVGLGVRYQTLIGPVRLEYGHNLNRRIDDPKGTLHLSIGFPF
ncbi:MAG: BamA/TamA family outer membrane protein [Verrucomicrobiota bacterium]